MSRQSGFFTIGVLLLLIAQSSLTTPDPSRRLLAVEPSTGGRDSSWVDKRIDEWQPTRAERAFDEIGWATDLRAAERLAKKHGRPIFLFTYDGANLAGYRC